MSRSSKNPTVAEAWKLVRETQKNIKEISDLHNKLAKKSAKDIAEWRASSQRTERQVEKTAKTLDKYMGDSGNQWGRLGENLVKGNLAKRLKERGFEVDRVMTRIKRADTEFDIVAINGRDVVVVEVRASLDPSDVKEFEQNIKKFKTYWPEFKGKTIYGAVAFLIKSNRQADILARKRGFLVIEAVGDVFVQNRKNFKPRIFS